MVSHPIARRGCAIGWGTEFGGAEKRIPCGNDRKKGKSKGNSESRFPAGMTERKAKAKDAWALSVPTPSRDDAARMDGARNSVARKSGFPAGMTERKARAKATVKSRFPAGMTERKARARATVKSRFPAGMTERKARTKAKAGWWWGRNRRFPPNRAMKLREWMGHGVRWRGKADSLRE